MSLSISSSSWSGIFNANPYLERNKVKDLSSLTFEETAVLGEVKSIVAKLGGSSAKVNVTNPERHENDLTISHMGFLGTDSNGSSEFAIGVDYLERMAADEEYKNEMLREIRRMVNEQINNKAETTTRQYTEPVEVPVIYMDFWNEDKDEIKSAFKNLYEQARQVFAGKYEANFTYLS